MIKFYKCFIWTQPECNQHTVWMYIQAEAFFQSLTLAYFHTVASFYRNDPTKLGNNRTTTVPKAIVLPKLTWINLVKSQWHNSG